MNATVPRGNSVTALLVGIDGPLATSCTLVLRASGLRVEREALLESACQRIPVMQPYLVVLDSALAAGGRDAIDDCVVAVGAEVVWIDPGSPRTELIRTLTAAAEKAMARGNAS
jgi:hypothetical protein